MKTVNPDIEKLPEILKTEYCREAAKYLSPGFTTQERESNFIIFPK